jgi:hypothetical protein
MRDDQFSQSLEMLDNGCLPDSAVDAEDVLLMLAQHYAYVFPSDSALAMLAVDTVAYIGDGGYRTARLDRLHEVFTKVATAPVRALDPYPGVRPQLTIWKRTPG